MTKIISAIIICLFFSAVAGAQQITLKCGGKYVGYDDQFIYLNWEADEEAFRDKLFIKDRQNGSIQVSLATSETLTLYPYKKYLSYWYYGKERIVNFRKDISLKEMKKIEKKTH